MTARVARVTPAGGRFEALRRQPSSARESAAALPPRTAGGMSSKGRRQSPRVQSQAVPRGVERGNPGHQHEFRGADDSSREKHC